MSPALWATWAVCAGAVAGIIVRPRRSAEWVWAAGGAGLLVATGLLAPAAAARAVASGLDVYLFLVGMMLLSEVARAHGLFDWLAAIAVEQARGSSARLFVLVYATGTVTTVFLSNDATAVVLTPAVYAAARRAGAQPLPLLFACALIANAASFVLPISNPANLVLYGGAMPTLAAWLRAFALPSIASIAVTFTMLRWVERKRIAGRCGCGVERTPLSPGGRWAAAGIAATAVVLLVASALDSPLGLPTAVAGVATMLCVGVAVRGSALAPMRHVSWSVLPLVGGLFVLVAALDATGVVGQIAALLGHAEQAPAMTAMLGGTVLAFAGNLVNNLPAGLVAGTAVARAHAPPLVVDALLIGVDLGPNLSITGSLATILWLQAIRREGEDVGFLAFLKVGAAVMPPALIAALGTRLLIG